MEIWQFNEPGARRKDYQKLRNLELIYAGELVLTNDVNREGRMS